MKQGDTFKRMRDSIRMRFPKAQLADLPGGGTNVCFLLNDDHFRTVVKVAMISEKSASTEAACLLLLDGSSYAPRLNGKFMVEGRTALHMEFVEGQLMLDHILEIRRRGKVQEILPLFTALGEFLAELHNFPIREEGREALRAIPEIPLTLAAPQPFIESALVENSAKLAARLTGMDSRQVLLHGDYGYHNVLVRDNGTCCLVDWELAGVGHPGVDIGNVLFWTHLHFPEIAQSCTQQFLKGYGAEEKGYSPDVLHAFVILQLWRIIGLVRHDFPETVKQEWSRRLAWALDHSFL